MHLRRTRKPIALLNVTPLIDVVFILLVFFMLTTNFARFRLIGVETPQEREVVQDSAAAIVIRLEDDGTIYYDGDEMAADAMAGKIADLVKLDPGRTFIVRPEAGVKMQDAIDAFQIARNSGATFVTFAGEKKPPS